MDFDYEKEKQRLLTMTVPMLWEYYDYLEYQYQMAFNDGSQKLLLHLSTILMLIVDAVYFKENGFWPDIHKLNLKHEPFGLKSEFPETEFPLAAAILDNSKILDDNYKISYKGSEEMIINGKVPQKQKVPNTVEEFFRLYEKGEKS